MVGQGILGKYLEIIVIRPKPRLDKLLTFPSVCLNGKYMLNYLHADRGYASLLFYLFD